MVDGKQKPISKVKEGEWVVSFDHNTKTQRPGKVTGTMKEIISDILEVSIDGKIMIVASSQRFRTPKGEWKSAPDAEAVLGIDGEAKKISAKKAKGMAMIYDITVRDDHSFFADGIMVHNGGGGGGGQPKPKPPPDPVVTAGKVGRPISIRRDAGDFFVAPMPGEAATYSVSHTGGISTGYHSVPGVPASLPIAFPVPRVLKKPINLSSLGFIDNAIDTRTVLCDELGKINGPISAASRTSFKEQFKAMRTQIKNAERTDSSRAGIRTGKFPMDLDYSEVTKDVADLEKFVSKTKTLTTKELAFVNTKCSEINDTLTKIKTNLTKDGILKGTPTNYLPGREYSNMPGFAYFVESGTKGVYNLRPPNDTAVDTGSYYKHFDSSNGLFYYDKNRDNAL